MRFGNAEAGGLGGRAPQLVCFMLLRVLEGCSMKESSASSFKLWQVGANLRVIFSQRKEVSSDNKIQSETIYCYESNDHHSSGDLWLFAFRRDNVPFGLALFSIASLV